MTFEDLIKLYETKKKNFGMEATEHISELLREAKEIHRRDWQLSPTPDKDHEQSWRSFKGKNLEKLIMYIIKDEIESLGLKLVGGNILDRTSSVNLSAELSQVKRNLLVDYGEFGAHLPDVDVIIYSPKTLKIIAGISSKVTLRERITQTGYWKIKLSQDPLTKDIKVFFITPDENGTLRYRKPTKKGRAIVEVDTDGSYVMSETTVEESEKVKMFDKFIEDLRKLLSTSNKEVPTNEEKPAIETTTLWDYPRQSYGKKPKGNYRFQGVTPAFIIYNLIQRYTKPGDLVVDPMAGSGTTIDVCEEEGRKVIGYDINPQHPKVIYNDSRKIPLSDNSVDLVFIDSPYGDNVNYSDNPTDIGKISAEDENFYTELEKAVKEIYRILKPEKIIGWLIGDQWVKRKFTPVGFKIYNMLTKYFEPIDIISVVRRGQSSHTGVWHYRAKKFNFFLRGFKYLLIMKKPIGVEVSTKLRPKINWKKYKPPLDK